MDGEVVEHEPQLLPRITQPKPFEKDDEFLAALAVGRAVDDARVGVVDRAKAMEFPVV